MCGIAGLVSRQPIHSVLPGAMAGRIFHRGPDDGGTWMSEDKTVAFGHRRLAIVDLSPQGAQPMQSHCGRYVLAYNGEIYNHAELRRTLDDGGDGPSAIGQSWHGHSDTETLLQCITAWGLELALQRSVGMFALALWDKKDRRLYLARDRFGEKPLYYGWVGGDFVFASELKAIRAHPRFDNRIDSDAVRLLAARSYIPAPLSIYKGIYKLEPGCILAGPHATLPQPVDRPRVPLAAANGLTIARYWSYRAIVESGIAQPIADREEALGELERVLAAAIAGQAVADVPVGAFLSGGVDSSLVVALYRRHVEGTIRTFSIGFDVPGYDEAPYARAVAAHLGTDHHEHYVTAEDARAVIPLLPEMYDEPFADSSQIPTFLVSRFARERVTVALSGDGGDELFGGYNRYLATGRLWRTIMPVPGPLRRAGGRALASLPPAFWDKAIAAVGRGGQMPSFGFKVRKMMRTIGRANGLEDIFESFLDEWSGEGTPVRGAGPPAAGFDLAVAGGTIEQRMMYCDAVTYLPDDILCKVDRAAMAVSLETRVPFLDHRVAAFAARIPTTMKIADGTGKLLLRDLLYRHVPRTLIERPKAGFALPVGTWLRGPLRDWAEDLLSQQSLAATGLFDPAPIRRRWAAHCAGRQNASFALWPVLMTQAWSRAQGS